MTGCWNCLNFKLQRTTKGYEMTQPIQEPTQDKKIAALEFRIKQLFRRPKSG